jgi:hypothetical protein
VDIQFRAIRHNYQIIDLPLEHPEIISLTRNDQLSRDLDVLVVLAVLTIHSNLFTT